jgi:molecular chaperone GrpE
VSAAGERQADEPDEVEHPETPVNPEEPGTSGLPDPEPEKRTEGGEGGAVPPDPKPDESSARAPDDDNDEALSSEEELEAAAQAVVDDVSELAQVAAERDEYLDALRHLQADFENYRKRVQKDQAVAAERGAETLVRELLPVLDAVDLARAHNDGEGVQQIAAAFVDALSKQGLHRVDPLAEAFDPEEHEAVMHEPGDGDPEVIEVLRAGYRWNGRVLRPAMVKVKGS